MLVAFTVLLLLHGLLHLLGVLKAFRLAELAQLAQPITPGMGVVWLAATILFSAAALSLWAWPRWTWAVLFAAIAVSSVAILSSWADAKAGMIVNVVALAGAILVFAWHGPLGLRAAYERDVRDLLSSAREPSAVVAEKDLEHLPAPVARYLRLAGVIGRPRVRTMRAVMHGRIRSGPDAPWMPLVAEQHNGFATRARFFYMTATRGGLPIQGYHRYSGTTAGMDIKLAGLIRVASGTGPEMTRAETVTMFNDMCVMAPATLLDPSIGWEPIDERSVRASFTNAGHTVHAVLVFAEGGELVNFWSDDRGEHQPDGTMKVVRWSTPLGAYRAFGQARLMSKGDARWSDAQREYAYIELELDEVTYNPTLP